MLNKKKAENEKVKNYISKFYFVVASAIPGIVLTLQVSQFLYKLFFSINCRSIH